MMTRKHYTAIADLFNKGLKNLEDNHEAYFALCDMAREQAVLFAEDNPRFDEARFLDACFEGTTPLGYGDPANVS